MAADIRIRIRISKAKKRFRKGYMASWSEELFTVGEAHPFDPPVYRLIDDAGTILDGTFYEQELQKVIVSQDTLYRVEAVLQRWKKGKRAEVLVKWSGYPASFNTWTDAKAVVWRTKLRERDASVAPDCVRRELLIKGSNTTSEHHTADGRSGCNQ